MSTDCLILCGPLYDISMKYIIDMCKKVPTIISTWRDSSPDLLSQLENVPCTIILNDYPIYKGVQNVNYANTNIKSACIAAKEKGYTHVMCLRTDMYSPHIETLVDIFRKRGAIKMAAIAWCYHFCMPHAPYGYIIDNSFYGSVDSIYNFRNNYQSEDDKTVFAELFLQRKFFNKEHVLFHDAIQHFEFVLEDLIANNIELYMTHHHVDQGNLIKVYKSWGYKCKTKPSNITAIVNVYKRPHTLEKQIHAILSQIHPPDYIFIWNNGNTTDLSKYLEYTNIRIFNCSHNFGVWPRFLAGFMAPTEYVVIFDDDTIPGSRWLENCTETMKVREALLGTIGVVFNNDYEYTILKRYGWDGNCNEMMPVDIVGHSWFFKKEWLCYFTRETPLVHERISSGEDIHFAYSLQKYANIPTYVPPHPSHDKTLWGSLPDTAWSYGTDGNSETGKFTPLSVTYEEYIKKGFRVMNQRYCSYKKDFIYFKQCILDKKPFALIRPADGEYHVLNNATLTNCDNWTFIKGSRLAKDLSEAISLAVNKCAYIGIPCDTDNVNMSNWYIQKYKMYPNYITFANIFVNGNWSDWVHFLQSERISFHYIGSGTKETDFKVLSYTYVDPYLVNNWNDQHTSIIDSILHTIKDKKGEIYMFSCGPIAKILIAKAWSLNPNNIYLDIGSSLDLFFKGSTNRLYTDASHPLVTRDYIFTPNTIKL